MLVNAAEAFWAIGDDTEVAAISAHAVALGESPAHALHYLLLAANAVTRDDLPRARSYVERTKAKKLNPDYRLIATLVQGAVEMEAAETTRRAEVYREVSRRMDHAANAYASFPHEPARAVSTGSVVG